ncbi:MAG TPA: folylpolyglutamate synthase/dihydrofolate synthase family protein [Oculatellaceae cyanobacterium]
MDYAEAINYLQSFPDMERGTHGSRGPTMSLEAMKSLLRRLGDPQNGRHTIHITGSKGKGSTAVMVSSILHEAGFETATFTSPHLHSYTERLVFNQKPISEERFARGISEIKEAIDDELNSGAGPFSTFGILTALFFYLASRQDPPVQWQIVEVGIGGRFDATNVFETKDVAVITAISLEHTEILGASQTEIAANKAGIITPGCFAVLAPQKDPSVRSSIGRKCHHVGAALIDVRRTYKIKSQLQGFSGQSFTMDGGMRGTTQYEIPLLGSFQVDNAATAAAVASGLMDRGVEIKQKNIEDGLKKAQIPGRLEILAGKSTERKPDGPTIIVDGAHNHESAAALTSSLRSLFGKPSVTFVIGVNSDKNISAIWRELSPVSKNLIVTRSSSGRAMDPTEIADGISMQTQVSPVVAPTLPEAMKLALENATADDIICVTGSLYLVADARQWLQSQYS